MQALKDKIKKQILKINDKKIKKYDFKMLMKKLNEKNLNKKVNYKIDK